MERFLKNKQEQLKTKEKKLLSIKDFISKKRLNPEIMSELKIIEEEDKKLKENKQFPKGAIKTMTLENLKRFVLW